jgi:hypothetical protein
MPAPSRWPACLFAAWPYHPRRSWRVRCQSPTYERESQQNYSHWLNHITLNHPDLLPLMPAARIRPDTLAGWLEILDRTVAPYTRLMRAADLLVIARALDPDGDWRFLQRAVRSLAARAVPSRNKEPRLRPSDMLVELGFTLMRKATTLPGHRPARAATLHRDGDACFVCW